ncbi:winged helix-turn-helix transcriptional regulator [Enterococcus pingfangensis]
MTTKTYPMGINLTLEIISGKWKPLILGYLGNSPLRNGELIQRLDGISQKVLTEQLRELEYEGIVQRKNYGTVPPKVKYSLTTEGESLKKLLAEQSLWGDKPAEAMQQHGCDIQILHPVPPNNWANSAG